MMKLPFVVLRTFDPIRVLDEVSMLHSMGVSLVRMYPRLIEFPGFGVGCAWSGI